MVLRITKILALCNIKNAEHSAILERHHTWNAVAASW
jgi:hypothetical protein